MSLDTTLWAVWASEQHPKGTIFPPAQVISTVAQTITIIRSSQPETAQKGSEWSAQNIAII